MTNNHYKLVMVEFPSSRDNEAEVSSVCASSNEKHFVEGGNSTPIISFMLISFSVSFPH